MIRGLGVDVVHIPRISSIYNEKGIKFIRKFLNPKEIQQCQKINNPNTRLKFLAGRWAAKEATYKAFNDKRLVFPHIVILNDEAGVPRLKYEDRALELAKIMGITDTLVSISHDSDYACATVLIQCGNAYGASEKL